MGYTFLVVLLFIVGYLYLITKENYDTERRERRELEETVSHLKTVRSHLNKEINQCYGKQIEDLKFVLKNEINRIHKKGLYNRYDVDDILRMITENSEVGIKTIQDIDFENFEKVIKIALYAEAGYLTWYVKEHNGIMQNIRIDNRGRHIILTEDEVAKMENRDFDFIIESIELR